jgi:hypothetical protein
MGFVPQWGPDLSGPIQTGPKAHPASCIMGIESLSRQESNRDVGLITHPFLASRFLPSCLLSTPDWHLMGQPFITARDIGFRGNEI